MKTHFSIKNFITGDKKLYLKKRLEGITDEIIRI
jgi:hypothetical protein